MYCYICNAHTRRTHNFGINVRRAGQENGSVNKTNAIFMAYIVVSQKKI